MPRVITHAVAIAALLSAPMDARAQPNVERFVVRDQGIRLGGEPVRIEGWNPPTAPGGPESVGLRIGADALDVWTPGCASRRGMIYVLTESRIDEPYHARFARFPAARARRARFDQELDVGCGDTLVFPDGTRTTVTSIAARFDASWSIALRIGTETGAAPVQATWIETAQDADLVVSTRQSSRRGPLGTPRILVRWVRRSLVVVNATDGAPVTVPRDARARLGRILVRYTGCGELRLVDGTSQAMCALSAELGGRRGSNMVSYREPWVFEGHAIEIASADENGAVLTIRRLDDAPSR